VRIRVRYEKTGKVRFISAIDLGRVWERALRKADLPIAFSEGFSPHPKISFTDALPLGYASTGEYAELAFAAPVALDRCVQALNAAFPPGVWISRAVDVVDGAPKFNSWLTASCWDMSYTDVPGFLEAVDAVRAAETLPVLRQRKGPARTVDLRPAIHRISGDNGVVRVILHHVSPPVRPSELHLALENFHPGMPEPTLITRVAQGTPSPSGLIEALSGDFVTSGSCIDPAPDRSSPLIAPARRATVSTDRGASGRPSKGNQSDQHQQDSDRARGVAQSC